MLDFSLSYHLRGFRYKQTGNERQIQFHFRNKQWISIKLFLNDCPVNAG